jgi:hypothetical protein
MFRHEQTAASGAVGLLTIWSTAADWGWKLLFAVAVAVLAPRVGHLTDLLIEWVSRKARLGKHKDSP